MGQKARLPPNINHPVELPEYTTDKYTVQLKEWLNALRKNLRQSQGLIEMPNINPIYQPGDQVWLKSYLKEKGRGVKLQPKFIGPYRVLRALPYQVYEVEWGSWKTLQHEERIKVYYPGKESRRRTERKDLPRKEEATPNPASAPKEKRSASTRTRHTRRITLAGTAPSSTRNGRRGRGQRQGIHSYRWVKSSRIRCRKANESRGWCRPRDKPAAEEERVGVVDVLRREMPARERRPPHWLGEYVSRLYRMLYYMT